MTVAERVWWVVTYSCVLWYLSVTIVVAVRGVFDIRHMLARLEERQQDNDRS